MTLPGTGPVPNPPTPTGPPKAPPKQVPADETGDPAPADQSVVLLARDLEEKSRQLNAADDVIVEDTLILEALAKVHFGADWDAELTAFRKMVKETLAK